MATYGHHDGGGIGILGESHGGLAGRFLGGVQVSGNVGVSGFVDAGSVSVSSSVNANYVNASYLSKAAGSFKIDHPLDPENKYLYHSFVESPDMMNIYNGNVTTDEHGKATVILPDYFEALNRDFRYQLTVIGQFAQAIVARKIKDHRFIIKTDKPNVEVSWQVTGIRQDAYANAHRIPVEEEKPQSERGTLLHPEAYGQAPKQIEETGLPVEVKDLINRQRERLRQSNR